MKALHGHMVKDLLTFKSIAWTCRPERRVYAFPRAQFPAPGPHRQCQWQRHHVTETPYKALTLPSTILYIDQTNSIMGYVFVK